MGGPKRLGSNQEGNGMTDELNPLAIVTAWAVRWPSCFYVLRSLGLFERLSAVLNSIIDLPEGINKTGHIGDDREADNAYAAFLRWRQPPDFVACYAGAG
jgi:hypothetical protein